MKVVKGIFGGTDDSAQQAQLNANLNTQRFVGQQAEQARGDIMRLFPQAQATQQAGAQQALDVFGQTIPQQFGTFQQGNVGAQQQLIAGLPQVQAAILGQPTDLSGFQPRTIDVNTDFAQQRLPQQGPTGGVGANRGMVGNTGQSLGGSIGNLLGGAMIGNEFGPRINQNAWQDWANRYFAP